MSPVRTRIARSCQPHIATTFSRPCVSHTYVSVALASYAPMRSRCAKSARRIEPRISPNTTLVNMPAALAIGYAA